MHAAHVIHAAQEAADFGIKFAKPEIDLAKLRAKKDKIVEMMTNSLLKGCKDRGITQVVGRGTFVDANTIQVENGPTGKCQKCIIAAGSVPAKLPACSTSAASACSIRPPRHATGEHPEDACSSSAVVTSAWRLGSVYASLGTKVTVVEMTPSLLPGVDADLVRPLHARLRGLFDKIYLHTKVTKIEETKDGIKAHFDGEADAKEVVYEKILVAVGRRPNTANLGLEKIGVEIERGFIKTDSQRRTKVPNLFAIGDAAGEPMLAHKAAHEGKLVVEILSGETAAVWDPRAIPAVVFTDPEIAWCGLTENDAKKQGRDVKIGLFRWGFSGRATTLGRNDGLTKVLVDPKTDQILGVGLVGAGAGELIAEGVVAIEMGATALDLAMCIHPHPTLSETVGEVAEWLHGLSSHSYTPKKKVL